MLTYNLDERGDAPLYQYLYRRIRDDILSGVLSTGERLPSKRALAEHLHVSVVTVEGAYGQLEAEGYVYTRPKRGVYVDRVEQRPPASAGTLDGQKSISGGGNTSHDGLKPSPTGRNSPWRLDLGSNRTDPALFPASAW
ncbi:MAG: GntR family transcriptional regulator, partial [Oscillibacter sp.]|nr:GntR family transcriptional regulator [Oscillibacter sp.]